MSPRRIANFFARRNAYTARIVGKVILDASLWALCLIAAVWLRFDFSVPFGFDAVIRLIGFAVVGQIVLGFATRLYLGRSAYGSFDEMTTLVAVVSAVGLALVFFDATALDRQAAPLSTPIIGSLFMVATAVIARSSMRFARERKATAVPREHAGERILVFGAGDGGTQAINVMLRDPQKRYVPVGILDDDPRLRHRRIRSLQVLGGRDTLRNAANLTSADTLLIAIPSATSELVAGLSDLVANEAPQLKLKVLPSLPELIGGVVGVSDIRELSDDDIIGRHQVDVDTEAVATSIRGRRVLVTGAGGSIGSELCRQLQRCSPSALVMVDRDESALHGVQLSIEGRALLESANLVLADIRDADTVERVFAEHQPDVVFHAAALKHLSMLERHPDEAMKTNVRGTLNVLDACLRHGVERFVNMSTDKAANPESVLGYSKRITERLTADVGARARGNYLSVRFGNVLGSRGSVLGTFQAQIASGGPVTVTDPDVTRFFMTVAEAVQLVLQAAIIGGSGEVMVLDMGAPVRIRDMAQRLIDRSGKDVRIVFTGLRPGEKLHEELFGDGEKDVRTTHALISHTPVPPLDPSLVLDVDLDQRADKVIERLRELAILESVGRNATSAILRPVFLSPPEVGPDDRSRILDAIDSGWVAPAGPDLDAFEHELAVVAGRPHAVAVSSGTAALHLALLLSGVSKGDRVVVPTLTFAATANAVMYCGAEPVFLDSEARTWGLDPALLEAELAESAERGSLPSAVIAVDSYGMLADYPSLVDVCRRFEVPLISDAAESLGSRGYGGRAGSFGRFAALSFNGNKIVTTSGGGALLADDEDDAVRARYLATQARQPVAHYEHTEVGFNYRMSNLLAALGRTQLADLDRRVKQRRSIFDRYRASLADLPGLAFAPIPPDQTPNAWLSCVIFDPAVAPTTPTFVREALAKEGIESRPFWKPMHMQPVFAQAERRVHGLAEDLFRTGLSLPSGSSLTVADQDRVISVVRACFES